MRLTVQHTTHFQYSAPVYESATEVRLHPANGPGIAQECLEFALTVQPLARIFQYTDCYGNNVHHFNVVPSHRALEVVATMVVDTAPGRIPAQPGDPLQQYDFLSESRYVQFDDAVRAFAEPFRALADPARLAEAVARRTQEVLRYEPGVTDVHSSSAEVMALGRGVCQDFAQIMIATCRYLGVPARYVSGYLYGGAAAEDRDHASHAWCEVYTGPAGGWIGVDPTHTTIWVDERYIRIGCGRDYADVPPIRGTFKGNATEQMRVAVRVAAAPSTTVTKGSYG